MVHTEDFFSDCVDGTVRPGPVNSVEAALDSEKR